MADSTMEFKTKSGLLIATHYIRLVGGGRGDYIEFDPSHMVMENLHIPVKEAYRPTYKLAHYVEYRSNDECNVKVYDQRRLVDYADYRLGLFYIAPKDLVFDGELK